jgi:hypothetical protein
MLANGDKYQLEVRNDVIWALRFPSGSTKFMGADASLVRVGLRGIGLRGLTGYLFATATQVSRADLESSATQYIVGCRDAHGRPWRFKPIQRIEMIADDLPPTPALPLRGSVKQVKGPPPMVLPPMPPEQARPRG